MFRRILALICAIMLTIIFPLMILCIEVSGSVKDTEQVLEVTTETTRATMPTEATIITEATEVEETTVTTPTETVVATTTVEETVPESTEPTVYETTTTPTVKVEYSLSDSLYCDINSELDMLACVIYQEAGGNGTCDMCRYRVADVVLNRIEHSSFPNSMYKVLTAKRQYGMFYWTGIRWPDRVLSASEQAAVARAYRVASDVLAGNHSELYGEGYIWQAEFVQGNSGFWCCGTFFGKN